MTQQALLLPALVEHLGWFARAARLQRAIGLRFADLNLLRRAFVNPSYGDRPERLTAAVTRPLVRAGTRAAAPMRARALGRLAERLRLRGMRRVVARMEQSQVSSEEVLNAPVEFHNQRLEFLGDAVLEFVVGHHLFRLFAADEEGELTNHRTALVNNKGLSVLARQLGFGAFALHGPFAPSGVRLVDDVVEYDKMLADCFEAFFGAVYLDQGLGACRAVLAKCIFWSASELPLRRLWLHACEAPYRAPVPLKRRSAESGDTEQAPLRAFEQATGLRFKQLGLLNQAFTHPSAFTDRQDYVRPPPLPDGSVRHNQRLEHLGDAVLQLASSDYLFHYFPEHREGQLSMLRQSLVNNQQICDVAATCGMHHCMRYYHEAMDEPGRARRGMLADCFEAFLGALFLDKQPLGMAHVKAFTHTTLFSLTAQTVSQRRWLDPKARLRFCLQEFSSQEGLKPTLRPQFLLLDEMGPSHERMYLVGCYVNDQLVAQARGQSLADAQMGAALRALEELGLDAVDAPDPQQGEGEGDRAPSR